MKIDIKDLENIIHEYKKAHRKEPYHQYAFTALDVILLKTKISAQEQDKMSREDERKTIEERAHDYGVK